MDGGANHLSPEGQMAYTKESGFLQTIVDDGITFNDGGRDAVEKLRVSNPESLIDTDFEYSLQAIKWEFTTLNNNIPGVFARSNEPAYTAEQITSIIPIAASGSRNVTVAVNITPKLPFKVGDAIVIKDSANSIFVDGAYAITQVPSVTSFVVTTKSPGALSGDQKTPYTVLYTGAFYENSQMLINGVSGVASTSAAKINFSSPHNLFIGSPINVLDSNQPTARYVGSFSVSAIDSDTTVTYQTGVSSNFVSSTTRIVAPSGLVYARSDGVAIHRYYDGGVQINPGASSPNAQVIRQTRKYFKYQSGKSVQFSTGVLFCPVYDVVAARVDTTKYNISTYPYYDFVITTDQYHGFVTPDLYRQGVSVVTSGFVISASNQTNPYNKTFTIYEVVDSKTFRLQIPVNTTFNPFPTTDFNPGGLGQVEVRGWNDATVRTGLFDEQNGIFFEYDGTNFYACKRQSTTPLAGTITFSTGSTLISSFDGNCKFKSQLKEGDYIVIKGQSYTMTSIRDNNNAVISPAYRGPSDRNIKIFKTEEIKTPQSQFNIDRLDGTGASGYVFDPNRMQMMFIDYSWYGAGKVRYGIRANDGKITYFHELYNNNVNTKAYMRSGNLPGRFEIQSRSKGGRIKSNLSTISTSLSVDDGTFLPSKGRILINNEYIKYTKSSDNNLTLDNRNTGGLIAGPTTASIDDGWLSFNQNCSPALSHWGVSTLIDGGFNEDKSYLFTASPGNILSANNTERAIISLRLAPSVDFGIPAAFGIRNLINRSALRLRTIGVVTTQPIQIFARINCESTVFKIASGWQPAGNASIAQYFDHTTTGTFSAEGAGGDLVGSFFVVPNAPVTVNYTNPTWYTDRLELDVVRDLGNGVLGGNNVYPDGPDVITVFAKTLDNTGVNYQSITRCRISWTEDQG